MTTQKAIVIDLRSPAAFKFGSMPGAKNVPFRHLLKELQSISNKAARIVFVEDDINVAHTAQTFAMQLGFSNVSIRQLQRPKR